MTDTFDAVLSEMGGLSDAARPVVAEIRPSSAVSAEAVKALTGLLDRVDDWRDRLAAAHAAEDSEIREILYGTLDRDRDNITTRNLVVVAVNALQRERERAEAAERDARELREAVQRAESLLSKFIATTEQARGAGA